MISKIDRGEEFGVVYDVVGTPTYAFDLANFIIYVIANEKYREMSGIYHYSNSGAVSRYDFAAEIERLYTGKKELIHPCLSSEFIDPVKKPTYTVFDHSKTESVIGRYIPYWRDSLKKCFERASE
jgi:dTDP-4-dehydrorhamnose reductase